MASEKDLREFAERHAIPDDPVGTRPPYQRPKGTVRLLGLASVTFGHHFGRLLWIALYALGVVLGASLWVCCPLGLVLRDHATLATNLAILLLIPILIPIGAGQAYAFVLVARGRRARAREVLRPIRGRALYFNVLAAGGLPWIGLWALERLVRHLTPWIPETLSPGAPFAHALLRETPDIVVWGLLAAPFAFAALDAVGTGRHFSRSLARSLGFLRSQPRLFAGYVLLSVLGWGISALLWAVFTYARHCLAYWITAGQTFVIMGGVFVIWFLLSAVFGQVVLVQFYREFVWREREAVAQDAPESA